MLLTNTWMSWEFIFLVNTRRFSETPFPGADKCNYPDLTNFFRGKEMKLVRYLLCAKMDFGVKAGGVAPRKAANWWEKKQESEQAWRNRAVEEFIKPFDSHFMIALDHLLAWDINVPSGAHLLFLNTQISHCSKDDQIAFLVICFINDTTYQIRQVWACSSISRLH